MIILYFIEKLNSTKNNSSVKNNRQAKNFPSKVSALKYKMCVAISKPHDLAGNAITLSY